MASSEGGAVASPNCDNCGGAMKQVLRCGICKQASYCSQKCQSEDWKYNHKRVCKKPEPKKEEQQAPPVDKEEMRKQLEELTKGKDPAYAAQMQQVMSGMMGIEPPLETKKPPEVLCQQCGKPCEKPKRCSVCRQVSYCSTQCQKDDWPSHKRRCEKPGAKAPPPPGGPPAPNAAATSASPPPAVSVPTSGASTRPPLRPKENETVVESEDVGTWYKHREWTPQEEKKQFEPQKVGIPETAKFDPNSRATATGSQWNAAGTWEDKNMLPWWRTELLLMKGMTDGEMLSADEVRNISGDASIVYMRGIPRFMYDVQAELTVSGLRRCRACSKSAAGTRCSNCLRVLFTIVITEFCWDSEDANGDPQAALEVKARDPPGPAHVKKAGQKECEEIAGEKFLPAVRDFLRIRVAEYKQLVDSGRRWKSQLPPTSDWTGPTDSAPQPLPTEGGPGTTQES